MNNITRWSSGILVTILFSAVGTIQALKVSPGKIENECKEKSGGSEFFYGICLAKKWHEIDKLGDAFGTSPYYKKNILRPQDIARIENNAVNGAGGDAILKHLLAAEQIKKEGAIELSVDRADQSEKRY